jgi:hypothetical protein
MSTNMLDHPDQRERGRPAIAVPTRDHARDTRPTPGGWLLLETADHDWFPASPGPRPADTTLRVTVRGGFHQTMRQARAGLLHGRHYQSLLHGAGLHDIHVDVRFETAAADPGPEQDLRALVWARGRRTRPDGPHAPAAGRRQATRSGSPKRSNVPVS